MMYQGTTISHRRSTHGRSGAFLGHLFLVVVVVGAVVAAFRYWRKTQDEDERAAFIFDTIDKLLSTLVTETRQKLSELSVEQVNEAGRVLWTRVIMPTPLATVLPVDVFVDLVRREWEKLAGVEQAVFAAVVSVQRLRCADVPLSARSTAPPGRA